MYSKAIENMNDSSLKTIISYARLAPSVHNTQPWRYEIGENSITVHPEPSRLLDDGDPTGRESWITFGVGVETLLMSARALGYDCSIEHLQTQSLHQPIATIKVVKNNTSHDQATLHALETRHTYRGHFSDNTVHTDIVAACKKSIDDLTSTQLHVIKDRDSIHSVAKLTFKGMSLALSAPAFRKELAELINVNWSPRKVGMHGYVLNFGTFGSLWEKYSMKFGLELRKKAVADQQKIDNAQVLLFVGTRGDVPHFWFDAGRAYMRIAIVLTKHGVSHSTIAAPVEAADFHKDIEAMIGTTDRLQTMMRIGIAQKPLQKQSPRLDVEELLVK